MYNLNSYVCNCDFFNYYHAHVRDYTLVIIINDDDYDNNTTIAK